MKLSAITEKLRGNPAETAPETTTPIKKRVIDLSKRADIKLGQKVREKITGFTGIVTLLSYEIDGSILVGVQPQKLDGEKPADPYEFDVERLEAVEDGDDVILNAKGDDQIDGILLGGQYRDTVTGVEGTNVRVLRFIGGCNRITIRPRVDKDGKVRDGIMVPIENAELLDAKPAEKAKETARPTGGPGTSERGMMARLSR